MFCLGRLTLSRRRSKSFVLQGSPEKIFCCPGRDLLGFSGLQKKLQAEGYILVVVIWLNLDFEIICFPTPFGFLECPTPSQFVNQIWVPYQALSIPKGRSRPEVSGFVFNSSISSISNPNRSIFPTILQTKNLLQRQLVKVLRHLPDLQDAMLGQIPQQI